MSANNGADEERVISDLEEMRSWAEETGSRPVVSATSEGSLELRFTSEEDVEGRELDWESFLSMYEASDVAFVVDDREGRQRFVDNSRVPNAGGEDDEDEVHPDGDRRDVDVVDRETDQIEREARETNNPDNHRDEEPFQS